MYLLIKIRKRLRMYNIEFISYALFLFWVFGLMSVLLDLDHLWKLYGYNPPVNLTDWDGRPLHDSIVCLIVSGICSVVFLALIYGLVGNIFGGFRKGIWLLIMLGLNIATYLTSWRLGSKLNEMLENDDYDRDKS